jgi:hypothetical protein
METAYPRDLQGLFSVRSKYLAADHYKKKIRIGKRCRTYVGDMKCVKLLFGNAE